jgi:hypothetical protein
VPSSLAGSLSGIVFEDLKIKSQASSKDWMRFTCRSIPVKGGKKKMIEEGKEYILISFFKRYLSSYDLT